MASSISKSKAITLCCSKVHLITKKKGVCSRGKNKKQMVGLIWKTSAPNAIYTVTTGDVTPTRTTSMSHGHARRAALTQLFLPWTFAVVPRHSFALLKRQTQAVHLPHVWTNQALPVLRAGPPRSERSCSQEIVGFCHSQLHISLHFIMPPSSQTLPGIFAVRPEQRNK